MKLLASDKFILFFSSSELIKKWVACSRTILCYTQTNTCTNRYITDLNLLESIPYRTKITYLSLGLKVKTAQVKGCKFWRRQCQKIRTPVAGHISSYSQIQNGRNRNAILYVIIILGFYSLFVIPASRYLNLSVDSALYNWLSRNHSESQQSTLIKKCSYLTYPSTAFHMDTI